jgi:hypothetical protein
VAATPSSIRLLEKGVSHGSEEKGEEEDEEEGLTFSGFAGAPSRACPQSTSRMRWADPSNAFFFGARISRRPHAPREAVILL